MSIEEKVLEQSLKKCQTELDKYRWEHKQLIGELLSEGRFMDVTDIFFKQGFLQGLRASSENRETIKNSLKVNASNNNL